MENEHIYQTFSLISFQIYKKKVTTKGVHMQITKHTTNKNIIDHSSRKTSLDSTWYGRRSRQKTSWKSFGRLHWSRLEDWKSSSALYFRRLPRRLPIGLPKSDPDLKNMYIKPRSEKPAYHIKKRSNGLKTEKMSGKLDRHTFIEHTKYISKWKMRTIWLKTCNKKID